MADTNNTEKKRPVLKWIVRGLLLWVVVGVALSIESGFADLAKQTNDTLVLINSGRHAEVGANPISVDSILLNVPAKMLGPVGDFLYWIFVDLLLSNVLYILLAGLVIAVIVLFIKLRKSKQPAI